jgi:hypothetical protein
MANEITLSMSLEFSKTVSGGTVSGKAYKTPTQFTMTGTDYNWTTQTLSTSEEAITLGEVGSGADSLGWMYAENLSSTSAEIIYIRAATGGTNTVAIPAGGAVLFKFPAAVTAPYFIAASGTPVVKFLLLED